MTRALLVTDGTLTQLRESSQMPDAPDSSLPPPVDRWLLPLDEVQPCGADLENDPEFLELTEAAGKPESQFAPGEPPDWERVRELSESLFRRTRDLRVALWWGRAKLNLDGFSALPLVLALFHELLERFWDHLHPLPDADEPDALARLSVIGGLDKVNSLLGDIRASKLSSDGALDGMRVRDVEVALGKLSPRADESPRTQAHIAGMLAADPDAAFVLGAQADTALDSLLQIQTLMARRFRADLSVDLATVRGMITGIKSVVPAVAVATAEAEETRPGADANALQASPAPKRPIGGVHSVDTRQDAIRAIELVCTYLERSEPTNPAQLFLRRAARVIDKNFLQLVHELAPDSIKDVARIMGVDPAAVDDQN
jgi:type VI secretion system protein ImpA